MTRLVADSEWGHWSNVEIARHCGVAHSFVSKVRRSLDSGQSDEGPRTYRTKHGTTATMDISHIGRATQGRMTSAPTPDDVPSVPEDQTAPNEVGAVSASETTLVVKEVHRGLAHDPDRFVLETRPKLTDVLVPSPIAPASTSLGSDLRAHLPSPEPEVGTDAVTSIMRLMDELAAALRRLDTEASVTVLQLWSPQLLDRCVHSSSQLMKHLHALQGAVYPPYLEMMRTREAEGGDLHVPASGVSAATVDSRDGVPSVAEGMLEKEEGMLPSHAEKAAQAALNLVDGSGLHPPPVDQRRRALARAKALQEEGYSPAKIAQRLNAAEGGRRWNQGSVLVLLRANISKVSAAC